MKQLALAAAALLLGGMAASAQTTVLKEAERVMKNKGSFADVEKIVKPAFDNAETKEMAETYYIPGKAAFNEFDQMIVKRQLGQLDANGPVQMANDLMAGYNYFVKALSFDSVPDAKGKVKPKYSKDIYNVLVGHYMDYNNAAIDYWNAQDYNGAYDAWGVILNLPKNPTFAKQYPADRQFPDSSMAELAFNRALAAFQAENFDGAMGSFYDAKDRGYDKKNLYDYAIATAERAKNTAEVLKWSKMAIPLYGKEDDSYIRQIINNQLTEGKFDEALQSINEAIANDPRNSQYQWVLGIIYISQKDDVKRAIDESENAAADPRQAEVTKYHNLAKDAFKKAIEFDANNDAAYVALGALTYEDSQIAEAAGPINDNAYYNTQVLPIVRQAIDLYEKAYSVNPKNEEALKDLEVLYYAIGDEANMQRVAKLREELD